MRYRKVKNWASKRITESSNYEQSLNVSSLSSMEMLLPPPVWSLNTSSQFPSINTKGAVSKVTTPWRIGHLNF